jgi:hypothetical protein
MSSFFCCVQWAKVRGDCWYWLNCWDHHKLSFHSHECCEF